MTLPELLLPATVLLPLGMAALILAVSHILPPRIADIAALAVSLAVMLLSGWLASVGMAQGAPVMHWFGGWSPGAHGSGDLILGIAFRADPVSAGVAAFVGLLFSAVFLFAWSYFDHIHSHFQVLMLLFLAGMQGFCLTGDLFNLFVWFELMSISAFALTAYPLGQSALDGAFNFVVTNAIAGFMMLGAVGLVYARLGTLDMVYMGQLAADRGADPVLIAALVLLAAALLTKAAIVPFHLWLADAHAVAPSPVSVVFSGAMVSVGLFGCMKLLLLVFAKDAAIITLAKPALMAMGGVTAIVGALMAWGQRHLKRLLAFSTISHLGIMLTGVASLSPDGLSGFALYLLGHGLVKGALFMVAGIMLALGASGDEIMLYRKGRRWWPAGIVMALGGLMLAGLPFGPLHGGEEMIHHAIGHGPLFWAVCFATVLTGAAVLRATLRIFAGMSGAPGVEATAPTELERERADRPFALMLAPAALLIALAIILPASLAEASGEGFALMSGLGALAELEPPAAFPWTALCTVGLAMLIAGLSLLRRRPVAPFARTLARIERAPFAALEYVHSGLVGDYVVWTAVGLAGLSIWIGWQ